MWIVTNRRAIVTLTLTCAIFAAGRCITAQIWPGRATPVRLPPIEGSKTPNSDRQAIGTPPPREPADEVNHSEVVSLQDEPARLPPLEPPRTELLPPGDPAPQPPPLPLSYADAQGWERTRTAPWWSRETPLPYRPGASAVEVTVDGLVLAALEHSEHVRAIRQAPLIWQEEIVREKAAFDVAAFVDSRWRDISEPVGSTLTTGGPPRFNDHDWRTTVGLRKQTAWGGTWELSQRIGLQDTNSVFFLPEDQGTTRFSLSFSQPLLRNRGRIYNQGLVVIAETNANIAHHTMVRRLEGHLRDTARAYWRLVLHRELAIQRRRHAARAEELLIELERRSELDLLRNQALRAQAAVATRRAGQMRAETEVRNTEAEIARLTGNARWASKAELVPVEPLVVECALPETEAALQTALSHRAEIAAAIARVRQAEMRLAMSRNELMPALNLVLETYLMGLEGDYDLLRSLNEQYTTGAPSYTAGLVLDMPLGNRAAQAGHRRRQHEAAQVMHELNAVLADTRTEVENAVRSAQTAWAEMNAKSQALAATEAELNYLQARWRALQGVDGTASFLLTDILDAQDRLMQAEAELSHARYAWAVSVLDLKHATGELMGVEHSLP